MRQHPRNLSPVGLLEKIGIIRNVLLPTLAKGVILRREKMLDLAERFDVDRRAVEHLQTLRAKYGEGPLVLKIFGRQHAVLLSADDMFTVLNQAPNPYTPASDEKVAALGHFEPHVSLLSKGRDRSVRRQLNDAALESGCPVHSMGERFVRVAQEEAEGLMEAGREELLWRDFSAAWDRVIRRIVLGDGARDDVALTAGLTQLRGAANWAFLWPRSRSRMEEFFARVDGHLARAEPGSLAGALAKTPKAVGSAPSHQVAHWLFAFDAGGIAAFSALALLSTHDQYRQRAIDDVCADRETRPAAPGRAPRLPYLRACVLESLRLWPTTMIVHRQSTEMTRWPNGTLPEGTSFLIFAPFFHRDNERLHVAHRFSPDIWLSEDRHAGLPFIPFSAGPGECPGRHIVLLAASAMLAPLVSRWTLKLRDSERLQPDQPLPGTLDHFKLAFDVAAHRLLPKPAVDAVEAVAMA